MTVPSFLQPLADTVHHVAELPPAWLGAAAAVGGAAASFFPAHRLGAGLLAAAAILALALHQVPCCSGCASGSGGCGAKTGGTLSDAMAPSSAGWPA